MAKRQTRPRQEQAAPEKVEVAPVVEPEMVEAQPKPRARKAKPKEKDGLAPETVIARKYGVTPQAVVKWRVEDEQVVALVDYGVKGTKKYKVPLAGFGKDSASFEG